MNPSVVRHYIFALILIIIYSSCKKDDKPVLVNGNNHNDDTSFTVPETRDIILYEINERAFSLTGDFAGITARLDSIKALSVNVIWLMPIHPIGTVNSVNSPYSVKNYLEVNPEYGTMNDLKNLVGKAHEREMAVILDWVANHTAWDNPWISNASWYTQVNGEIVHPPGTNWLDVADLNYNNADMRQAMISAMKFWIEEANVDGFRCDAADMVPFDFWKQAIDSLQAIPDRDLILLAEGARADHFTAGFQMNFSWNFYGQLKNVFNGQSAATLFTTHNAEYNGIPDEKHKLRFTTNHDESAWDATPMVLFDGADGALAASVIAIYLGGVPLIYGSQEVGRQNTVPFFSNSPIDWTSHPEMLNAYKEILSYFAGSETMKKGSLTTYNHNDILFFQKSFSLETVLVLVNVRNNAKTLAIPAELQNTDWTDVFSNQSVTLGSQVDLSSFNYMVLKK
jgi:glycosidase